MATHENGTLKNGTPEPAGAANGSLHFCPTRIDRMPVLFAHKVSTRQCQDRQRGHYHKCFTCAWQNARVSANGRPSAHEGAERKSFARGG